MLGPSRALSLWAPQPRQELMAEQATSGIRDTVFISKATPGDDEFVLWLAPRLEAAGYKVFADILCLDAGGRWRKQITATLQERAIKMLLCCQDSTLAKDGVQEEISIASDLVRELPDPTFIIPLKIKRFKKLFGIADLQYVDFERSWAKGLDQLLAALEKQGVPKGNKTGINQDWEAYRRRDAIAVIDEPEALTSNWVQIVEQPNHIRYFEPTGAIDQGAMKRACSTFRYPAEVYERGFFSFATATDVQDHFVGVGRFRVGFEATLAEFLEKGLPDRKVRTTEARNMITSILRQAWNAMCRERGLFEHMWSKASGFHVGSKLLPIGQKVSWGRQGDRRSSMLRNLAGGYIWQFGGTAQPNLWPYPHFKLKTRVVFAEKVSGEAGSPVEDAKKQHRLRRRICKGWRNKQWHGRMMALLELLSGDLAYLYLAVGSDARFVVDATPIKFTLPVTTELPDELTDDDEESDESTITVGAPEPEEAE